MKYLKIYFLKLFYMLYLSSEVEDLNESYPRGKLRTWAKPPTVLKNRGMPGEMGKPVQIPKVRKKI